MIKEIIQIDSADNENTQEEVNPDTVLKLLKKPFAKLRRRKPKSDSKQKILTSEEIEKLLTECKSLIPNFYPVILLGATTDLRLFEILDMNVEDIDFDNHIISVNGRLAARSIKIEENVSQVLKNYLKDRERKSGVIFKNVLGEPIAEIWAVDNFRKLLKLCGFSINCHLSHKLRKFQKPNKK